MRKRTSSQLTRRELDAVISVVRPYAEGIATLVNSKGDGTCFKTEMGRLITATEMQKIEDKLRKQKEG